MDKHKDTLKFTGKRKTNPTDRTLMLVPPPFGKCHHYDGPFEIDKDAGDGKCLKCGERVTAILILTRLMNKESQWNRTRLAYQDEMKRLNERSRTKCQHCDKMTRISGR